MANELPTIKAMRDKFPDYPCGKCEGCLYKGDEEKSDKCARTSCRLFVKWFKSAWQDTQAMFEAVRE